MFERPRKGDRAVLVNIDFRSADGGERLAEFRELAISAGAEVVGEITGSRNEPHPRYYVGEGKADEIAALVEAFEASVVIFNHDLSPSQERNLEKRLQCRCLDRAGLILDIFAQRARSYEGKLQVELAQLSHLSTRLVRGWTHLERQKGGIGLRGPGETQLETDRRLIGQRIKQLQERLARVRRQRGVQRNSRRRAELPTVSLVGYTNAGKSSLFNRATAAGVWAEDQLFATLDPTLRRVQLSKHRAMVLADTVGFIRDLPHELVAAFRSTLEETREADLLLHVVDASDPERDEKIEHVDRILAEIGAGEVPQLRVYNKIDLLDAAQCRPADADAWISAQRGDGMQAMAEAVLAVLNQDVERTVVRVPLIEPRRRAMLFEYGEVCGETVDGDEWVIDVEMSAADLARWSSLAGQRQGQ